MDAPTDMDWLQQAAVACLRPLDERRVENPALYADQRPCPSCGGIATCETVDVGVGLYFNPEGFSCACGWDENGPLDYGFVREDELDNQYGEPAPIEAFFDAD